MWILICIMGLCWGSFLNVLIVRTLSGESIISPPSKCPKCNLKLLWWHNIPIISYILLKGKCHFCNKSISIQYPIVELAGLGIWIFSFTRYVSIFDALSVILILSMLLVLSFTDIKSNKVSIPQMLVIFGSALIFNRYDIGNTLLGAGIGAALIAFFILVGDRIFNKRTFGIGDVYLLAAFGAVVGGDRFFLFLIYVLFVQFLTVLPNYIMTLWRSAEVETLKYLIFFMSACLFLYVLRNISFVGSKSIMIILLAIMLYLAYNLVLNIFNVIKNGETQSYCPVAPAVAIGCLIFLL